MQNPLQFYTEYNSCPIEDTFAPNAPDASIESDVFGPCGSNSMTTNQMSTLAQPSSSCSVMNRSNKRKATTDTDMSYSPASIYSDHSSYSDVSSYPNFHRPSTDFPQSLASDKNNKTITSGEEGSSDDNDDDDTTDLARKREKHTQVEAHRRALEKAHFRELALLIASRNDSKSTKLHHLDLLKLAAEQITEMNTRHKNDPLRPSNLTDNELNFLTIEASNSFLFVTTIEPSRFRIIHVTDAINRVLNLRPDQWLEQDFLSLIHQEDFARYRSQLMSLNQRIGMQTHIECRLKQGNSDTYSPVIIDGMTKIIDHSLKPVQGNTAGFLAFIGICHLPLITKYSETNMCLYKNPHICTFCCRCSPNDWKIFLVDRSVSTLPSVSYDIFRQKSILDFIHSHERAHVHQALLRATTAATTETISCTFMHPTLQTAIPMTLEIKSMFNAISHRADFIELTFKSAANPINTKIEASTVDFINDIKEIDRLLLEADPSLSTQTTIQGQINNNHPTTQNVPYYYSSDWPTKTELF